MTPKIICLIPTLPSELNLQTLRSVTGQTVPVTFTVLLTEKVNKGTLAAKISKVLNNAVKYVKLEDFDYVLVVATDMVLPPNFIEGNLNDNPDVCGLGSAMLIKTSSLRSAMGGQWDPRSDDSAIHYQFMRRNLKATLYTVKPTVLRKVGKTHNCNYYIEKGFLQYQMGYDPVRSMTEAVSDCRISDWRSILCVIGYAKALVRHAPKCAFADYVRYHQLRKVQRFSEKVQTVLRGYGLFNR